TPSRLPVQSFHPLHPQPTHGSSDDARPTGQRGRDSVRSTAPSIVVDEAYTGRDAWLRLFDVNRYLHRPRQPNRFEKKRMQEALGAHGHSPEVECHRSSLEEPRLQLLARKTGRRLDVLSDHVHEEAVHIGRSILEP